MIADAHSDLLLELVHRREEPAPFAEHWLPQLRAGGVGLQVAALYAPQESLPEGALRRVCEQIVACRRLVAENPGAVAWVRSASDLARVEGGMLGIVLSMEGAEPLGVDPDMVFLFWELGVRLFGLTWNRRNAFADGAAEPEHGGLSHGGSELIDRLAGVGAIIDLAHASRRTFDDVLHRAPEAVVIVSHTGCRALIDTPRNVDDRQMRLVAERGGVVGIMAHPVAIDPAAPTLSRVVDHILHALEVAGPDHVCLGADFIKQVAESGALPVLPGALLPDGICLETPIDGFEGPSDYPALIAELADRGVDSATIEAVAWKNLHRTVMACLP